MCPTSVSLVPGPWRMSRLELPHCCGPGFAKSAVLNHCLRVRLEGDREPLPLVPTNAALGTMPIAKPERVGSREDREWSAVRQRDNGIRLPSLCQQAQPPGPLEWQRVVHTAHESVGSVLIGVPVVQML